LNWEASGQIIVSQGLREKNSFPVRIEVSHLQSREKNSFCYDSV
jgi:hypothetical protein